MKTLLVCDRSAGHVFPALALAEKLIKQQGYKKEEIYFFATASFLVNYIKKEGFSVVGVSLGFRNIIIEGLWRFIEALYIIFKLRPKRVFGFGGRDSLFLVLFSSFLFKETAIYEPNVVMGKANKILSFVVKKVLRGFRQNKIDKRTQIIGILLRKNITKINKDQARKVLSFDGKPVVLCLGGSQGASFINHTFLKFVEDYKDSLQIIHLTGKKEFVEINKLYNKIKNNKFVKDFYYDMEILYSAADVVVSRAGAATLGEISFYGLPSLLLPYPKAGGHQSENAYYLEKREAACVCLQNDFSFEKFSQTLQKLIDDASLRKRITNNLKKIKLGVSFEDFCSSDYI